MDKLLTPKDLAESLQVGLSTVYQWVNYGFVPCVKIGSLVRFREAEIEKWLQKNKTCVYCRSDVWKTYKHTDEVKKENLSAYVKLNNC